MKPIWKDQSMMGTLESMLDLPAQMVRDSSIGLFDSTLENNFFSEWLYGEYNEQKLRQFELLHNVPVISNYMDYLLDRRADQEYLDRYGMDYTDIHDPRKLSQVSSGSNLVRSGLNFVSDNVKNLYR